MKDFMEGMEVLIKTETLTLYEVRDIVYKFINEVYAVEGIREESRDFPNNDLKR